MLRNLSWAVFCGAWLLIAGIGIGRDATRTPWIVTGVMVGLNGTVAVLRRDAAKGGE